MILYTLEKYRNTIEDTKYKTIYEIIVFLLIVYFNDNDALHNIFQIPESPSFC